MMPRQRMGSALFAIALAHEEGRTLAVLTRARDDHAWWTADLDEARQGGLDDHAW